MLYFAYVWNDYPNIKYLRGVETTNQWLFGSRKHEFCVVFFPAHPLGGCEGVESQETAGRYPSAEAVRLCPSDPKVSHEWRNHYLSGLYNRVFANGYLPTTFYHFWHSQRRQEFIARWSTKVIFHGSSTVNYERVQRIEVTGSVLFFLRFH